MDWGTVAEYGLKLIGPLTQAIGSGSRNKQARLQAEQAQARLDQQREMLNMLDTSNPYTNLENSLEDVTVNLKEAEMQRDMLAQSQANTLDQLRQGAGTSGIAALATALAQRGDLQAQKIGAQVGKQEAAINLAAAKQAQANQTAERQGEVMSRQMEFGKLESQMGIDLQLLANAQALQAGLTEQKNTGLNALLAVGGDYLTENPDVLTDLFSGSN
tara:strand:- start:7270 stop:7917 length:648 start_codon:yes stop_codon:yes gene_type:complete